MNAQDKQREQFDLWVRSRGGDVIKRGSYYVSSMTREWWRAWQAALQAHAAEAAQAQSGDWVVVPREPTEWMLQAAEDAVNAAAHCESTTDDLSAIAYKAALAAAPQPQAAEPVAWRCFDGNAGFQYYHGAPAAVGAGIELLYTHPQPPAQSGASKFVHSSPESRQAVLERVAERATQAQLEQSAQCAKDAARGIDARGHGAAPAGGP